MLQTRKIKVTLTCADCGAGYDHYSNNPKCVKTPRCELCENLYRRKKQRENVAKRKAKNVQ